MGRWAGCKTLARCEGCKTLGLHNRTKCKTPRLNGRVEGVRQCGAGSMLRNCAVEELSKMGYGG